LPEACDFFNGWWRDSSSLIVYHDSYFVYWFGWFKYILMHVWMLDFHLLSNCINWGYWSLVMHEFTLALVGSINTFILYHYFLRRMILVATLWTDGSYSWANFKSMGITDTASKNIAVCRMSSLLLIFSTFFDDNSGAGSTQDYFELQLCSGWSWWQKTPWTTAPGKVAFPRSCRLPSARHPNGFSPFL